MDGIKILFDFLVNEKSIDEYNETHKDSKVSLHPFVSVNRLFRGMIGLMFNLSRSFNNYSNKFKECNAADKILSLIAKIAHIGDNKITLYMIFAAIASDDECDKIADLTMVIGDISQIIGNCLLILYLPRYQRS